MLPLEVARKCLVVAPLIIDDAPDDTTWALSAAELLAGRFGECSAKLLEEEWIW